MPIYLIFAFLTFLFMSLVSFHVWNGFKEQKTFLFWSAGMGLQGLAWLSFGFSKWFESPIWLIVPDTIVFVGHSLCVLAFLSLSYEFLHRKVFQVFYLLVITFLILELLSRAYTYLPWNGWLSLIHSTLDFLIIIIIVRERRPENRAIIYTSIAAYGVVVFAAGSRAIQVLTGIVPSVGIAQDNSINIAVILGATFSNVIGTITLSLISFTKSAQKLRDLANQDPLTLALNRRAWHSIIEREIARSKRLSSPLSTIMFDIDLFKQVNDNFGHDAGDQLLKSITSLVQNQIRKGDVLFRFGGEEFMVLLPGEPLENAINIAEHFRKMIETHKVHYHDESLNVTSSFGVTELKHSEEDDVQMLKRVDKALYRAKDSGRNRVISFEQLNSDP